MFNIFDSHTIIYVIPLLILTSCVHCLVLHVPYGCIYSNGCSLPCGLSSSYKHTTPSTLPKRSDFDYEYHTAALSSHTLNNTMRRNEQIFVDPRTGLMYSANSIKRSDVSGTRDIHNDCYQHTSVASATHIYDCPNYDATSVHDDEDDYTKDTTLDKDNTLELDVS